jgi:hypothetical protein
VSDNRTPEQRRADAIKEERRRWRELRNTYERCVAISEQIWSPKLEAAAAQQQTLAEQMRDRPIKMTIEEPGTWSDEQIAAVLSRCDSSIPVPLFTPRDRLQFLKEAAVALLISADRRNLTSHYRDTDDAETETPPAGEATEAGATAEAQSLADAGMRPAETDADSPGGENAVTVPGPAAS